MMQQQHEMGMISNTDPMISEEQAFNDFREDHMDPPVDFGPGPQQDYFDSEYGSSRSLPPPSFPPPKSASHATAALTDSKLCASDLVDSENTLTPRAMAAFQEHQEFFETDSANTKRSRNDPALARQDSAPSIPSSSDMISVKNIEDREDEYGKMKLALLSDIVDTSYNNGSFSPVAAITSPSLAYPISSPRTKTEGLSSPSSSNIKLGSRTRSKDNLESIFGGTTGGLADKTSSYISNTSVVNRSLLDDDQSIARGTSRNVAENITGTRSNAGLDSTTTTFLPNSNPTTCKDNDNIHRGNINNNRNKLSQDNHSTVNTSQIKTNTKYTKHAKCPSSPPQAHNYKPGDIGSVDGYSSTASLRKTKAARYPGEVGKRTNQHPRPSGCIMEEPFPLDISPDSDPILTDFRSSKAKHKGEAGGTTGTGGKRGATSTAACVSATTTGDVYTIPEVPEEEELSSPLGADGVSRRKKAGRL